MVRSDSPGVNSIHKQGFCQLCGFETSLSLDSLSVEWDWIEIGANGQTGHFNEITWTSVQVILSGTCTQCCQVYFFFSESISFDNGVQKFYMKFPI